MKPEKHQKTGVKTRKQIADEYGISPKILSRWLKKQNIKLTTGLITPKEQENIYNIFGKPKNVPKSP